MDENILDMLLELEDEGFILKFNRPKTEVEINPPRGKRLRLKDIKDLVIRIYDYRNYVHVYTELTTKNRIVGALPLSQTRERKPQFTYRVKFDKELFDAPCVQRSRYSDIPLYLKNNLELLRMKLTIL